METYNTSTVISLSPAEINRCNQIFWEGQCALMNERLADHAVASLAFENIQDELKKPHFLQRPYEAILEDAERAKKFLFSYQARKGGKAEKRDVLNDWIFEIAEKELEDLAAAAV